MKCAVLCNGPSRIAYTPSPEYALVMGCNIPWAEVHGTVILDPKMVDKIVAEPDLITCHDLYLGTRAKKRLAEQRRLPQKAVAEALHQRVKEYFSVDPKYHSSGHCAAEVAIRKGATSLDIYGCDSYFEFTTASYTKKFFQPAATTLVDHTSSREMKNFHRVRGWRTRWETIKNRNPKVTFNFIQGPQLNKAVEP